MRLRTMLMEDVTFDSEINVAKSLVKSIDRSVCSTKTKVDRIKTKAKQRRINKHECWSSSDDEILIRKIHRYNNQVPSADKISDFIKPRKCCPRVCYRLIPVPTQQVVHNQFVAFEKQGLGDSYLANCMELPKPDSNISAEIASESNGNMEVSNEIQNAINESLRDQEIVTGEDSKIDTTSTTESMCWIYHILVDHRQRTVCFQFLLNLFRIPISRIHDLQLKILQGEKSEWKNQLPEWHAANRFFLTSSAIIDLDLCHELFEDYRIFYWKAYHSESTISYEKFKTYLIDLNASQRNDDCGDSQNNLDRRKETTMNLPEKFKSVRKGKKSPNRDVLSLMVAHLKTLNCSTCSNCTNTKKHKFVSPNEYSIEVMYEDYKKYFLKETNSELGLRFPIYEKLLLANRMFTYKELPIESDACPKCLENPKGASKNKIVPKCKVGTKKMTKIEKIGSRKRR